MVSKLQMTPKEWAKVKDNPIQRDTEKHAAKARHLEDFSPTHAVVYAAKLPSGDLVKLDGHTRSYMWSKKQITAPDTIEVIVFPVASMGEAEALYKTFDAKEAMETVQDKVSGGLHAIKLDPNSGLLQRGSIGTALKVAWAIHKNLPNSTRLKQSGYDLYRAIRDFVPELAFLDRLGIGPTRVTSAVVAAIIVSYRRHGDAVEPFWTGVFSDGGRKANGRMDGIQAVNELILSKRTGGWGGSATYAYTARILMAVEKWINNETLGTAPRALDLIGYTDGKDAKYSLISKERNGH